MAILAFEENARLGALVLTSARGASSTRIIDCQHDDRSGMADDIAAGADSAGFGDFIGSDVEDRSFICDAGRKDARAGRIRGFRHEHNIKVCCAGEAKSCESKAVGDGGGSWEPGFISGSGAGERGLCRQGNHRARRRPQSLARGRSLARKVGARALTLEKAALDAELLWLCVPDRKIAEAASAIARRAPFGVQYAFHSSGALLSGELDALREAGVAIASVHPLMTFVPGSRPSLAGVPFALEGDAAATKLAKGIVVDLGAESFFLSAKNKAAYHAWATMTSPLLLAYFVTLEKAARVAGLRREDARKMSLPIIQQTLENYRTLGPGHSFSGPFIRGDAGTVARHLALLTKQPRTRAVYVALAQCALAGLPARNRKQLWRLLVDEPVSNHG